MPNDYTPLIGIPTCVRELESRPFHGVGERYVLAVAEAMSARPLLIPSIGNRYDCGGMLDCLDGLMVTGSMSMVDPCHYGSSPCGDSYHFYDPKRDATTLPLIRAAIDKGVPLLCICRGIQELNVALGGTLHQQVHLLEGKLDHRDRGLAVPVDIRFGPAHRIRLSEGGLLSGISPLGDEFWVNSLHTQAINHVPSRLMVEAVAEDGVVEAVSVKDSPTFSVGVQWHPEWKISEHPFSVALFDAFAKAARDYANKCR
jgi:putative glutamine amidotransferase